MKRVFALVLVTVLCLGIAQVAAADDGPMDVVGIGGSVKPMKSTTIRMAAETVQAICYSRFAEYKIDFRFENSAATQTVVLGFPFTAPGSAEDYYHPAAGFRAWQDGRRLAVALRHGSEADESMDFYTHTAVFPPGESTVTVSYLIAPGYGGDGESPADARDEGIRTPPKYAGEWSRVGEYAYTLHTGSYWAGTIGTAVLRWTLAEDFVGWGVEDADTYMSEMDTSGPNDTQPTDDELLWSRIQANYAIAAPYTYQWVFHSVEPALSDNWSPYDVSLYFFTPASRQLKSAPNMYTTPSAHASSTLKLGAFEYPAVNLVDGDPSTAWAEGAKGDGVGQWVDVTLPYERTVREVRILPGYAKRPDLFAKYNRPKRLRLDFSDGSSTTVSLADAPALQRFPVRASADKVRVTILDVYRGSTRDETYISEIEFGGGVAPTFEDPATLLASAGGQPSADATPAAPSTATIATVASASPVATAAPAKPAGAPGRSSGPGSRSAWALSLAGIAVAVAVIWRLTP